MKNTRSTVTSISDFIKKHISGRRLILLILSLIFGIAYYTFVKIEFQNVPNKYFEALYWIITTMTTVGYGDVVPVSHTGKIVAMFVMVFGVSTIGFIASEILSSIVSSNLGALLGVNKIRGRVDFLICGWNQVSNEVLKELRKNKHRIVVIDYERREELTKYENIFFIKGNPVDKNVLQNANIKNTGTVILSMDNDSDVILGIHVIREINPYVNIVAKINSQDNLDLAKNAGADHIVGPAVIAGKLLLEAHYNPSVLSWIVNSISDPNFDFFEYDVSKYSTINGKNIGYIRQSLKDSAKIIGVDTENGLDKVPYDDYKIIEGNKLILLIDKNKFRGLE